jgi:MFS family permease
VASRILLDIDPLRDSRDFRLLFTGQLIAELGAMLAMVAIPFQVYALTRSSLQVGAVSLAQLGPLILGALAGGTVGDALGRRPVLVAALGGLAVTSGGLAATAALAHPPVAVIYLVSAVAAGLGGVLSTICTAAVPSLVAARQLIPAYATMQVVDQIGMVAGPALAGLLIGVVPLSWVYALVAASYLAAALIMWRLSPGPPPAAGSGRAGLGSIAEGLRYLRGRQALQGAYLICIAGAALLTVLLPGFRRYRQPAQTSRPAQAGQPAQAGPETARRGPDVAGESTVPPGPCPGGTG